MKILTIGSPSVEEIRHLVNDAAQRTFDHDIQRAARALGQQSAGRKANDDRAAIAEAELGLKGSRSEWAVLLDVARKFCPLQKPRSAAERLRRKLRKKTSTK
jgi:hypothetical protein